MNRERLLKFFNEKGNLEFALALSISFAIIDIGIVVYIDYLAFVTGKNEMMIIMVVLTLGCLYELVGLIRTSTRVYRKLRQKSE